MRGEVTLTRRLDGIDSQVSRMPAGTAGGRPRAAIYLVLASLVAFLCLTPKAICQTALGQVSITAEPLPASTDGPFIDPAKGFFMQELGQNLFFVTDGIYQCMFLVTTKGVILVDAPPSIGANLIKAIREVTAAPVTHLVYSHSHADHIGSAKLFPNAIIISQRKTAEQVARDNDPNRPVPHIVFEQEFKLHSGGEVLELSYFGANHAAGNIFIYAPKQKVLMLVDVFYPGWSMFESLAFAGITDLPGWFQAQDRALTFDFRFFVSGHVNRFATKEDLEVQRKYVADLRHNAIHALQTVDLGAIAARTGARNSWLLFSTYLNAVAQSCADDTLAKWKNRLGAADVFTFSHCNTIVQSLRFNDGLTVDRQTIPEP